MDNLSALALSRGSSRLTASSRQAAPPHYVFLGDAMSDRDVTAQRRQ